MMMMITMLMMTNVSQIPAAERTAWIPAKRAFGEGRIDDDDDDDDDDDNDDDDDKFDDDNDDDDDDAHDDECFSDTCS